MTEFTIAIMSTYALYTLSTLVSLIIWHTSAQTVICSMYILDRKHEGMSDILYVCILKCCTAAQLCEPNKMYTYTPCGDDIYIEHSPRQ